MTGLVLAVYFSAKANSGVVLWLLMPLEIIPVGFIVDYGTWRLVLKEDIIEYSSLRQKNTTTVRLKKSQKAIVTLITSMH